MGRQVRRASGRFEIACLEEGLDRGMEAARSSRTSSFSIAMSLPRAKGGVCLRGILMHPAACGAGRTERGPDSDGDGGGRGKDGARVLA